MVEDKLISKNKLLMYLADLQLAYSPVHGKGDAVKYNFIRSLSDMIELWEDETNISKTESVECEDCISRESACQKMMEMCKEDCEMYGVEIPECFDGHRAVRALMELPPAQPEQKVSARKGRWIKHNTGHSVYFDCSLCGCLAPCTETEDKFLWKLSNYCPDCGADMRDKEGAQGD